MTIAIPLGMGSRHDNIELRYALRSFEKYVPHDEVLIIGERPEWLQNVTHVQMKDIPGEQNKAGNIYRKILKAFETHSEILFANDDHFILKPIAGMPYYHKGTISVAGLNTLDSYTKLLQNTIKRYGLCNNFDAHCPIIYQRDFFPVLPMQNHGVGIKTAYCVSNGIAGEYYPDCKISTAMNEVQIWSLLSGRQWFSIGNGAFNGEILKVLEGLYPEPSKYESHC